jgi:hypothetical protein
VNRQYNDTLKKTGKSSIYWDAEKNAGKGLNRSQFVQDKEGKGVYEKWQKMYFVK